MDFDSLDQLLEAHGLQDEPAFKDLNVVLGPLPPIGGSPLGLYYPDPDWRIKVNPGTIWVPPESDEETMLHELGHRYGHYYYNDLSESFAEKYRLAHTPAQRGPAYLEAEDDHTLRNIGIIALSAGVLWTLLRARKRR